MKSIHFVAQTLGCCLLVGLVSHAQEGIGLRQLGEPLGIKFGFEISPENLVEQKFCDTLKQDAAVGTMTTYWQLPSSGLGIDRGRSSKSNSQEIYGTYDFNRPKLVEAFCIANGIEIHGHTLVWARDSFTPAWVLNVKGSQAISLLRNHVSAVVSEFEGTVRVWHVVNEAFDYEGNLVDCHWNRVLGLPSPKALTPRYVNIAFQAAAHADPKAQLIYNDYGQEELDPRKFNAIIRMLVNMRIRGIPIHGLGWQLHLTATQVLDPDFPLEARLNMVAQLGFDNYITELDIVMDERRVDGSLAPPKSVYLLKDLARQSAAYQKVTSIFTRAEGCTAMQFWGVSDKQSWLGAERKPLIFDKYFRKKSAYDAVAGVLSGATP